VNSLTGRVNLRGKQSGKMTTQRLNSGDLAFAERRLVGNLETVINSTMLRLA
jgi:hypothetical protein